MDHGWTPAMSLTLPTCVSMTACGPAAAAVARVGNLRVPRASLRVHIAMVPLTVATVAAVSTLGSAAGIITASSPADSGASVQRWKRLARETRAPEAAGEVRHAVCNAEQKLEPELAA